VPEDGLTQWLVRLRDGDGEALDRLLPLVYDELRTLARSLLRNENPGHTLGATALVHEAYMRLARRNEIEPQDRTHFFAIAAQAMRRILIDHARLRGAQKRGSGQVALSLEHAGALLTDEGSGELLMIDEALDRLSKANPRAAQVVERRFFAGLTLDETAASLGLSTKTVQRDWTLARAWLQKEILRLQAEERPQDA
jgi:RNA polymerase sigma factor (TIGR02999 family)